jgi:ArsR family transcriptional regulator, lead/cadmium/zinc/bismuth-responsive transcriptional repressor
MSRSSDIALDIDGCAVRMVDADKVTAVRTALPADHDVAELADVFALLGDPNRLRILTALAEGGEMCVCDVAASAQMSESAASHALRLLRAHRIVEPRRAGRMTYYRLADAHVRLLIDVGLSHTQHTEAVHPERDA